MIELFRHCQTKEVAFYFAFIAWWHIRRTQ